MLMLLSKRIITWGLLIIFFGGAAFYLNIPSATAAETNLGLGNQTREKYEKALVLEAQKLGRNTGDLLNNNQEQQVKIRVLSGPYTGKEFQVVNSISGSPGIDILVKSGDQIVVDMIFETGKDGKESIQSIAVADRLRSPALGWLALLFVGFILMIGRLQGLKAILGLGLTALGIYKVLLPGLIAGKSALPLTILVLVGVTLLTMVLVAGFSRKSLSAILGTLGGLLIAGLLAYYFGDLAQLSGLSTEEERMLLQVNNLNIDMRGLLFSGILIGALGAVMDVAISVASTVSEVRRANPSMKYFQLMSAGMNVGRDIMGTMSNTLILAYTGSALPLMLLFMSYKMEAIQIMNWELIATEIVRALVGSIGLVASIPITALVAGWLSSSDKTVHNSKTKVSYM